MTTKDFAIPLPISNIHWISVTPTFSSCLLFPIPFAIFHTSCTVFMFFHPLLHCRRLWLGLFGPFGISSLFLMLPCFDPHFGPPSSLPRSLVDLDHHISQSSVLSNVSFSHLFLRLVMTSGTPLNVSSFIDLESH